MKNYFLLLLLALSSGRALALEVEGFLTHDCRRHTGLIVNVSDEAVEIINLQGNIESLPRPTIDTLYVFNVIENPIEAFNINEAALKRLKAVYIENTSEPRTLAFPVRFIEDLVIFYSLTGQSHVHTLSDIYKMRPAGPSVLGRHSPKSYKAMKFELYDQSAQCPGGAEATLSTIKPTRLLADKISISEYLHSFEHGYESLESFQERTYLYAKPYLYEKNSRLGLVFQGAREEPGLNFPVYFQWSTGEAYRFQSFSAIGMKRQEFIPNAEPVVSVRSDVKSHIFHGVFIGNVAGLPAGNPIFLDNGDTMKLDQTLTVQPSFNYLAMMGGDYGPYSLSVGFFYPTFGIRVAHEYREVLGSSVSYAVRAMYTRTHFRMRALASWSKYSSSSPTKKDVLMKSGDDGQIESVAKFDFSSVFLRGGIDYEFSDRLSGGVDTIIVNGNYKESADDHTDPSGVHLQDNNIRFNRLTFQPYIRQSFSNYVSLTAYADLLQNNFKSHFLGKDDSRQQQETNFFGTFEFIF
ncbi:MAG: hypothetical protein ACXVA9_01620 [Bdellovibrionales bacterium]